MSFLKFKPEPQECVGGYRLVFDGMREGFDVGALVIQRDEHPRFGGGISQEQARANAERMIACWNACEGISTRAMVDTAGIFEAALDLANERDELLAMLKAMAEEFRGHDLPYGSQTYADANALINKIEGRAGR